MVLHVGTRRRPGADVAGDVVQRDHLLDHKVRRGKFRERELDRLVTLFGDAPFRRPKWPDARISYRVATAEASGLEDASVDLVTAACFRRGDAIADSRVGLGVFELRAARIGR